MRFAGRVLKTAVAAAAFLFVAACGGDVSWKAKFDGTEKSGTSTGGTTIGASGTFLTLPGPAFLVEGPVPAPSTRPPLDLAATGHAMVLAPSDREIIDAVQTPSGVVALCRDPSGSVEIALLAAGSFRSVPAPENAERLLRLPDTPLRLLILAGELAFTATLLDS